MARPLRRLPSKRSSGSVTPDGGATASEGGAPDGGAPPTPAGTLCGLLADGQYVGCVAGGCYTTSGVAVGSDQGTCKPFASDNGACDIVVGPGCLLPARCVVSGGDASSTGGTCVVPVASMCSGS